MYLLQIVMSKSNEAGGVYKGPHNGVEQAYIVTAPFEFVEQTEGGEPVPTGLKVNRMCHSSGTNTAAAGTDPPNRLQ